MRRHRSLTSLAVALALVVGLAGCGGSDDDGGDEGAAEATTTEAAEEAETTDDSETAADPGDGPAADPYDGYTSEVYDDGAAWICRPDLDDDACRDLDVTSLDAEGGSEVEEREPAADPPVDCFYVYPTVSQDAGVNSDMEVAPGDNETTTVIAQAAQYARTCRVFAPIYRQVTLSALGSGGFAEGGAVAYGDVVDAWKTYISTWNEGRGVILIGHSQGTGHLKRLISDEIDGNEELLPRLVAAHLFGGAVQVPEGEVVGGDYEEVPGCEAADQTGCIVSWSSYPLDYPPAEDAIFGTAGGDPFGEAEGDTRALCTDPLALLDRDLASPVAPTTAPLVGGIPGTEDMDTAFVALPESLTLSCEATDGHDYLAVGIAEDSDPRPLDGLITETLGPTWGLHLVDMTVALDDLVDLAAAQAEAHTA
jgi:hypothetical protein